MVDVAAGPVCGGRRRSIPCEPEWSISEAAAGRARAARWRAAGPAHRTGRAARPSTTWGAGRLRRPAPHGRFKRWCVRLLAGADLEHLGAAVGQIPCVAGLPFFMVTFFSSFMVRLVRHFTQYASVAIQALLSGGEVWSSATSPTLSCASIVIAGHARNEFVRARRERAPCLNDESRRRDVARARRATPFEAPSRRVVASPCRVVERSPDIPHPGLKG